MSVDTKCRLFCEAIRKSGNDYINAFFNIKSLAPHSITVWLIIFLTI